MFYSYKDTDKNDKNNILLLFYLEIKLILTFYIMRRQRRISESVINRAINNSDEKNGKRGNY